ncbi:MerR family transcriptional regulator [Haliangium sp. UPWRP_2]|uniref:MerR family transcriptional regulator n=1 Tax=Haliangium sp. UPWRP_2 TaxID=1931276 RepID=UPI000B5411EE|nr:MerR family transcriptional regulator [Haliangium sp. UPWRP_2]PSM32246.1 MerR family DNA-binding transcriptional regulator [Haliangium sp. UPWRP_2]HNN92286.1 MerR family transcriptional regulator [Pseudomonadota bacterium]
MSPRAQAPDAPKQRLTLRAMVRGANTTARAVRFYEAQGLIQTMARSPGGHRWFAQSELDRLRLVIDLRACGLSIEEIRTVLLAKEQGTTPQQSATAVQSLLNTHLLELSRKATIIQRLSRELGATVQLLDQCAHCDDPRGLQACTSCELPSLSTTPPSFHHIWTLPQVPSGTITAAGGRARSTRRNGG